VLRRPGDRGFRPGRPARRIDVIGVLDARIKRVCVRAALLEIGARVGGMTEMLVRVALQALGFGCLWPLPRLRRPGAGRGLTGERLPAFDVDRVLPNLFADLVGLGDAAALTLLAGSTAATAITASRAMTATTIHTIVLVAMAAPSLVRSLETAPSLATSR